MASINIRIDDDLKARAYLELEKLGVTPSELMRQALQYVACLLYTSPSPRDS